jgi:hypothetical protein
MNTIELFEMYVKDMNLLIDNLVNNHIDINEFYAHVISLNEFTNNELNK